MPLFVIKLTIISFDDFNMIEFRRRNLDLEYLIKAVYNLIWNICSKDLTEIQVSRIV